MGSEQQRRFMSSIAARGPVRILSAVALIVLCVLCLQPLCGCSGASGDEWAVEHAIKYADSRVSLDMAASSVVGATPDAKVEISLMDLKEMPNGVKEIKVEPAVVSDTMASWGAGEWAKNRDDLYFNLGAHFNAICKQAHDFSDLPEGYEVTCPEYMVVYDSQKKTGFIVSSTGVYHKTDDPENPIGEAVVLATQQ